MKNSRSILQSGVLLLLASTLLVPVSLAQRGGGGRGGGSRGGGSRSTPTRSAPSSSRSSAARSGRGTVSGASTPSTTPSRSSQQHANSYRSSSTSTSSSSRSYTGLALAAGATAGVAATTAVQNRGDGRPAGYGSVTQSERLRAQVASSPASRSAMHTSLSGSSTTRAQAQARVAASGRDVVTTLPVRTQPIRVPHHRHHHYRRPYSNYYWTGSWWYRPYYYSGYVYYEQVPAPVGGEVEALPEGEGEIVVIEGEEYLLYEDAYYTKTDDGYVVADPYGTVAAAEAGGLDLENSQPLQVLRAMSTYLETMPAFNVEATETHDSVEKSGERVQRSNQRRLFVTKPNMARSETTGDGVSRQLWYDGKQVTIYSKGHNSFATVDAPNTLPEMVMSMTGDYGLPFPLADVLYTDLFYALSAELMTADYVGLHKVGDVVCDHLAFSQETIDWQIWVEKSAQPIPRKIQITYKLEPGAPVYTMEVSAWSPLKEQPSAYRFTPPKDAIEIEMEPL
jgi:hypothetical protein